MIEISDTVKDKIRSILDDNPGKYLRIVVDGNGCGGPYLGLSLDEPNANEKRIKINGIDVLISDDVERYSENTTINIIMNLSG
jgi:Fe-S cluster assembly iron-binding protein IscA